MGVPKCLFWPKHVAPKVDVHHESVPKDLEKERNTGFHLLGRHSCLKQLSKRSSKGLKVHFADLAGRGDGNQLEKIGVGTDSVNSTLGVSVGLPKRLHFDSQGEVENHEKTIGKNTDHGGNDLSKDGSHFGQPKEFFAGHAYSQEFHRQHAPFHSKSQAVGLASSVVHPPRSETGSQRPKFNYFQLARKTIFGQGLQKPSSLRFFSNGLGMGKRPDWPTCARVLERTQQFAHKSKGVGGSSPYGEVTFKTKGHSFPECGQFSDPCIFAQGVAKTPLELDIASPVVIVHGARHSAESPVSKIRA